MSPEQVIKISNTIQQARLRRTKWLFSKTPGSFTDTPVIPYDFAAAVIHDIERLIEYCKKKKLTPCIRLNGTSDLRWEKMPFQSMKNIFSLYPRMQFYDYTKQPLRNRRDAIDLKNYHLTYSLTEQAISGRRMREYMQFGINTAVVFQVKRNHRLPSSYAGYDVIDGDVSDLRFKALPYPFLVGMEAPLLYERRPMSCLAICSGRRSSGFLIFPLTEVSISPSSSRAFFKSSSFNAFPCQPFLSSTWETPFPLIVPAMSITGLPEVSKLSW